MPRAVDPPGRLPVDDYNPASKNILFDPATMPKFNLLKAWLKLLDMVLDWLIAAIKKLTNGNVDLGPLKEIIMDTVNDFVADIGTGQNLLRIWKAFVGIISEATGIDLNGLLVELLPQLIELMSRLKEIADAGGQAVYELIMLPLNILRQIQIVISGGTPDWSVIPDAFRPLLDAMRRIFALMSNLLGGIDLTRPELILSTLQNTLNTAINRLANLSPLNWNPWAQIRGARVPASHVAEPSPELLDNPDFIGAISLADLAVWAHDEVSILPGSVWINADGTRKTLVSNPIQVSPGLKTAIEVMVNYQSVQAATNQNAIRMSVNTYDWQANKTANVFIAGIASPWANATNVKLAGTYTASGTAGAEDAWIAVQLDVMPQCTAGVVRFHHASAKAAYTTPQIGFGSVAGIAGIFDIGSTMQTLWDQMQTALKIDLPGIVTGASLSEVAQSLHELARNVGLNIQILRTTRTELGLPPVTPENAQVASPGTHVLTLPIDWDYVDAVALGGGGGGGALLGMIAGTGGWYGQFRAITLIRANRGLAVPPGATDWAYIHENATTVTMFVGAGGAGGSGLVGEVGHDGQASTISWNLPDGGVRTVTAPGGPFGGTSVFTNPNNPNPYRDSGKGPGTLFYRGKQYIGGVNIDRGNGNVPGSPPGGGGGPGILRVIPDFGTWGGPGAHGSCWMRAYVAAELEVTA